MNVSRRDLLKLAAGSAVGILFTPLPWKVLDDTAIWTQNWPWIPEPPKGETTSSSTTCTLCPAGCGMKARCVNGMPVSLSGIPGHPFGNGSLCAVGLAAHHLSFHPLRVRQPLHRIHARGGINSSVVTNEEALTMLLLAIRQSTGSVAILDRRPGRSISLAYRQWLGRLSNGVYLSSPSIECQTAHFTALNSNRQDSLGYDLEHARTILSFGTPLFGGWGSPGRMMKIAAQRRSSGSPMVIQVETRQSRTALMADTWIPVAPGTEGVFALGLAYVLLNERLIQPLAQDLSAFHDLAATFTPEKVAAHTGVSADIIIATARRIAGNLPAVAIGGGDPGAGPWSDADMTAVASLNTLFGAVGIQGGLLPRRDIPGVQDSGQQFAFERTLQGIPDHSIAVLIMDGAEDGCLLPWELIEPKLANERALVVSLSPFLAGLARRANLIIPSPVPLERLKPSSTSRALASLGVQPCRCAMRFSRLPLSTGRRILSTIVRDCLANDCPSRGLGRPLHACAAAGIWDRCPRRFWIRGGNHQAARRRDLHCTTGFHL